MGRYLTTKRAASAQLTRNAASNTLVDIDFRMDSAVEKKEEKLNEESDFSYKNRNDTDLQ